MKAMWNFLKHVLAGQNQFASGGLLLMIVGAIGAYLRALPQRFWYWLVSQTTMMISVKDDDAAFVWVKEWFLEQRFLKRIRQVDMDTTLRGEAVSLIPAPGRHRFWFAKRPFWVWFSRSEDTKGWTPRRIESLTFRTIGRQQIFLKKFVDEIVACHKKKVKTASYLYLYDEGWSWVQAYTPRWLDSVILKPGEKEHLIEDIRNFRNSWERYRRLGVPYHRGYLLYGPPGTGKTSLVSGLGAKFGMSIYAVNLTEFNDRTLKNAINDVPANSIVLFEDIDCMKTGNARTQADNWRPKPVPGNGGEKIDPADRFGVTLSGLLNVLDGFNAPENVLFVMTTNRIETLDAALLRPGRIDYKLFMGQAAKSQKVELYRSWIPMERNSSRQTEVMGSSNNSPLGRKFAGLRITKRRKEITMPGLVFLLLCRLLVEVVRVGVRLARKAKPRPICADCAFAHVQYAANGRRAISCTFGGMVRPMKLDVLDCTDYRDRNRPLAAPIGFVREIANAGNG